MTGNQPFVRVSGVHLTLISRAGPVNILKGIDLAVAHGESVALLGPSGSGKSSLLGIIAGLERPSDGTVDIGDTRLDELSEDGLALFRRHNVGIVFQTFHLIPTMTALENVALPLELAGADAPRARAESELAAVGLAARRLHYPGELSGGEQQRVAIARALVHAPALVLADEPTGNLDSATGEAVIDLLFSLHDQRGTTLILVTHDPALAERSDRVIRMRGGRLREGPAARTDADRVRLGP